MILEVLVLVDVNLNVCVCVCTEKHLSELKNLKI